MTHSVSPDARPALGGLHAGWASFGALMIGTAPVRTSVRPGLAGWLRGSVRRLAQPSGDGRDSRDIPAHLLADLGLDPCDGRSAPSVARSSDGAVCVAIRSGTLPRL
jgi:hypothetical protein